MARGKKRAESTTEVPVSRSEVTSALDTFDEEAAEEEQAAAKEEQPQIALTDKEMQKDSQFETKHVTYPIEPTLNTLIVSEYDGESENGLYHGKGKATFVNGNTYVVSLPVSQANTEAEEKKKRHRGLTPPPPGKTHFPPPHHPRVSNKQNIPI